MRKNIVTKVLSIACIIATLLCGACTVESEVQTATSPVSNSQQATVQESATPESTATADVQSEGQISSAKVFPQEGTIAFSQTEQEELLDALQDINVRADFFFQYLDGLRDMNVASAYEISYQDRVYEYYPVNGYTSLAELRTQALEYFSLDFVRVMFDPLAEDEERLPAYLLEVNGVLYARDSYIAPSYTCFIPEEMQILSAEGSKALVLVAEEPNYEGQTLYSSVLQVVKENGHWVLDSYDGINTAAENGNWHRETEETATAYPTAINVPAAEIETLLLESWYEASPEEAFRKAVPDAKCTVSDLDQDGNQETWFLVEDYNRVIALVVEAQPDGSFTYLGMTENLWQYDGEASTSLQLYQGDGQTVAYAQCVRSGAVAAAGVQTYDVFVTIEDDILISDTIYYSSLTGEMEDVDDVAAKYYLDIYSGEEVSREEYLAQQKVYLCGASLADSAVSMKLETIENYEAVGSFNEVFGASNDEETGASGA